MIRDLRRIGRKPRLGALLPALVLLVGLPISPATAPAAQRAAEADTLLATFDGGEITPSEFAVAWRRLLPPERPPGDLLRGKQTFLVRMVDRKLLAIEARRKPVTLTPKEQDEIDRARTQMIQNDLFHALAEDLPQPTAEELELFERQKTKVAEVRFVSFPDWGMARSWRMRLATGTPASALDALLLRGGPHAPQADSFRFVDAREIPDTLAGMIWALRPGQVSELHAFGGEPVLIQVRTYEPHPIRGTLSSELTLGEEYRRKQYDTLRSSIRNDISARLERTFVDEGMDVLLRGYMTLPPRNSLDPTSGVPLVRPSLPLPVFTAADTGLIVARSTRGELTLVNYLRYWGRVASFTRPEVRDRAALEACVDRVLFEDELVDMAESRGLDRSPALLGELDRMREGFALDHYFEDHVASRVRVDDAALRRYFAAQPRGHYDDPETLEGRIIVLDRRELADSILALARGGASFPELAKQHSIDAKTGAEGGKLGEVRRGTNQNAGLEDAMFATPVGEIRGPEQTPEGWVVWKVEARSPGLKRSFEDAREWVERDFRIVEGDRILEKHLAELRKKAHARIFADRVTEDLGAGGDFGN